MTSSDAPRFRCVNAFEADVNAHRRKREDADIEAMSALINVGLHADQASHALYIDVRGFLAGAVHRISDMLMDEGYRVTHGYYRTAESIAAHFTRRVFTPEEIDCQPWEIVPTNQARIASDPWYRSIPMLEIMSETHATDDEHANTHGPDPDWRSAS